MGEHSSDTSPGKSRHSFLVWTPVVLVVAAGAGMIYWVIADMPDSVAIPSLNRSVETHSDFDAGTTESRFTDAQVFAQPIHQDGAELEESSTIAQENAIDLSLNGLDQLESRLDVLALSKATWSLSILHNDSDYRPLTREAVLSQLAAAQPNGTMERAYLIHFREVLTRTLTRIRSDTLLLPISSGQLQFARKGDDLCLLFSGVVNDSVFNTMRLTTKQRAARVVESTVMPMMGSFSSSLRDTEIDWVGIIAFYGARDFLNDPEYMAREEAVCVLITFDDCRQYNEKLISQDELLRRSSCFVSGSDAFKFARVEIEIE